MDALPEDYVAHNQPLILLSGIGDDEVAPPEQSEHSTSLLQEGGFRIRTNTSPLTDVTAQNLLRTFMGFDCTNDDIGGQSTSVKESPWAFKIQRVGRAYALPPRKASPPPHAPRLGPLSENDTPPPPLTLHSTISPLTPSSPLYPDGIITPLWITKHQRRLPAVFIAFFSLTADPNTSSLHDNQVKIEIGHIRGVFSSTNYKTKLVVILVGASEAHFPADWDERIGNIRRATGLDSRQIFFFPPEHETIAAHDFVKGILTSLQPFCVEYYRDLSKHTRRKRNRGHVPSPTVPPTSGTSRTLSLQGWHIRYEFKLGVFAEFRQEMDAACRNYESAHDGLFGHEIFETISNWSPRFNETRLLADAVAIRTLRCLLWTAQPTAAARFWTKHRDRTKDIIDRNGKGSDNYGWEAWQATWSKSFAQLLASAQILDVAASDSKPSIKSQYAAPEKSIPVGSRIAPWEMLHHDGYWWNQSWKYSQRRRDLAYRMPEEDRTAPGKSPASIIANRAHLYDDYLALAPHHEFPVGDERGFNHSAEILGSLRATILSFSERNQIRCVEGLRLEQAKEHMRKAHWQEATAIMRSIWPCLSWRQAGWWKMVSEAAWTFKQAARHAGDAESILRLEWEAQNSTVAMSSEWKYDLDKSLEDIEPPSTRPNVVISSEDGLSPIWASLYFANPEGNVGEPLKAQIVLTSTAHRQSGAILLSEVEILFQGPLRPIKILSHNNADSPPTAAILMSQLTLHESSSTFDDNAPDSSPSSVGFLETTADISMQPGQTKVFDVYCTPREAGDIRLAGINLRCHTDAYSLLYSINHHVGSDASWWSLQGAQLRSRQLGRSIDAIAVNILPKPPKIRISLPNMHEIYYTNEKISLTVLVQNQEVETADVSVEARLMSPGRHAATIKWDDTAEHEACHLPENSEDASGILLVPLPQRRLGSISSADDRSLTLMMDRTLDVMEHELEVTAYYHLLSDKETRLCKTIVANIHFARPVEATCELLPRLDSTAWPSFFDPRTTGAGLSQHFQLTCKIACSFTPPVIIDRVSVNPQNILGDATCEIDEEEAGDLGPNPSKENHASQSFRESRFHLIIRKNHFGDVRPVAAELTLLVHWRRTLGEDLVSTPLEIPRYVIPVAEPRVLLCKKYVSSPKRAGLVHLQYTIENPSMHYLTFNLSMESSEEFAFSGPKAITFSLVPVSRHAVDYRILANQGGRWVRVSLAVTDAYFSKSLRINPGGDGIKSDGKRGLLVWVE